MAAGRSTWIIYNFPPVPYMWFISDKINVIELTVRNTCPSCISRSTPSAEVAKDLPLSAITADVYWIPLRTCSCSRLPVVTSHSYTAPSVPHEINFWSSVDQTIPRTRPLWPFMLAMGSNVMDEKICIMLPCTAAKKWPPFENAASLHPKIMFKRANRCSYKYKPRIGNSRTMRKSSIRMFNSRSLSPNPARIWWPFGWMDTVNTSSEKSFQNSIWFVW